MILLEFESAIIRNLLERGLNPHEQLSDVYECCDFDGVRFKISRPAAPAGKKKSKKEKKTPEELAEEEKRNLTFIIQMFLDCTPDIAEYGAQDQYEAIYGKYKIEPESGFTHAIEMCFQNVPEAEQKEMITLAARLKANILGAPFIWVAERFAKKENFAPFMIPYRRATNETIFITPSDNGAIAVFSIRFSDPGDRVIGGVFFSELLAAKTRVNNAPIVTFSNSPPGELKSFDIPAELLDESHFAFVSIGLLAPQLSDRKKQDIAYYVPMFRDYLHYHIKCTKAFLHLKMRSRTASMLKVLENAKPEPKHKVRRTVTGKVMNH